MRYICCTKNVTNLLIIALIQVISAVSLGILDYQYKNLEGISAFNPWFVGGIASLAGCLLAGVSLSRMENSRTKSFVSKVRTLRCVFATMFTIALLGSSLLLLMK